MINILALKKLKTIIPIAFVLLIGFNACLTDKGEVPTGPSVCDTLDVSYNDSIKPILEVHCNIVGCHSPGGTGTGDFTNYDAVKAAASNGSLNNQIVSNQMPQAPGAPLNDQQKQLIKCWTEAGAPNN